MALKVAAEPFISRNVKKGKHRHSTDRHGERRIRESNSSANAPVPKRTLVIIADCRDKYDGKVSHVSLTTTRKPVRWKIFILTISVQMFVSLLMVKGFIYLKNKQQ